MEQALTAVCKDIRLGKILIQTNHDTGEPEVSTPQPRHRAPAGPCPVTAALSPQLHYLRLPKEISEDYVILMDSTVSTGAAAMMAVRVLLVRGRAAGLGARSPPLAGLSQLCAAGPRRAGGQDLPAVAADGRDGGALGGLRLSSRPHHHHRRGQEDQ